MHKIPESYYNAGATVIGEPDMLDRIEQNLRSANQLRSVGSEIAETLALLVEGCHPSHRCFNAACVVCAAAAQQVFVRQAKALWPDTLSLVHITIVPTSLSRSIGNLTYADLPALKQHLVALLREAGYPALRAQAFVDLSHDIDQRTNREFWLPHYHVAASASEAQGLTEQLNLILSPSAEVARPALAVRLNDPDRQFHYIAKPRPTRVTRFGKRGSKAQPCKQWLKPREHIESLLWLGRYFALDRIVRAPG